jgi:hypothetical protein
MAIQIRALRPTAAFPLAGKVYTVEPSPRVRILLHKNYIERIDPALREQDPVIPDDPDVEVPVLADDNGVEDDEVATPSPWAEVPAEVVETVVTDTPATDDWTTVEDDEAPA